jgi:hypothetical protein
MGLPRPRGGRIYLGYNDQKWPVNSIVNIGKLVPKIGTDLTLFVKQIRRIVLVGVQTQTSAASAIR